MKEVLATILALVMALGVTTMAWADGESPDMSGTVVNVTAANAQDVLDGKYGDIDGKTINFTESIDSVLVLARPTKYEGSKTVWYNGAWTNDTWTRVDTPVTEVNGLTANVRYYVRTVSNVAFTANSGVTIKGVYSCSGIVNGSGQHDYVVERNVSGGDLYYGTSSLKNISFEGITFTGQCNIESSLAESVLDGVTFTSCTFNINNTTATGKQAIRFYSEEPTGKVKNLVVDGCTFNSCYQGVYAQDAANVTVTGCTFNTTGHNAIAVQGNSSGTIVIKENYIDHASDRAIRFGDIRAESTITVNNNIMVNSGDGSGELFKAGTIAGGVSTNLENNYWSGKDAATAVSNNGGVTVPTKTGITGGTFKGEVTAAMLAEGYTATKADDTWTVSKTTASESAAEVTATTETENNKTTTTITTITANEDAAASGTNTIDVGSNVVLNNTVKTAEVKVSEDVLKTVVTESATAPVEFKVAENASVTFNKEAVKSIAKDSAFTGNITLVVTPDATVSGNEKTAKQSVTTDANAKVVELKLVGDGDANLFKAAAGAKATVTVPFDAKNNNAVKVYYLKSDGTAEYVGAATINNNNTVTFTVSHFSNYVLVPTTVTTYHYYNAGTSTTTGNTTSSPKTFDAGVGIYAVSAVLSVTGMAYVGKKKF